MHRRSSIIFGVVLFGFLTRLFILSQRGSLWFDEAFSVHFASMDLRQMWEFLRFENNPPLYFAVLHFWVKLFGASEIAVRSLSMIFGLSALPLIYALGAGIHSRTAGYFAAFIAGVSGFQAFYATEARMYALYLFLTLCAAGIYLKLEARRASGRTAAGLRFIFFLLLSALIWTHITAWFIVLAFAVYILWKSDWNMKIFISRHKKFLAICGLLAVQFMPWALTFIRLKIAAPLSQGYFFHLPPDRNYFLDIAETFLAFGEESAFVITLLSVVMITLLWRAVHDMRGTVLYTSAGRSSPVVFLLCWLAVPLLVGFAFSNAVPRYFIATAPALYLLMGIGFANLMRHKSKIMNNGLGRILPQSKSIIPNALLFIILFTALILPSYSILARGAHHRWDDLARWISQQTELECRGAGIKCLILINPHSEILPFERYYNGALPVEGFYPAEDGDSRDMRIVKTNWISFTTKENIRALAEVTTAFNKVFLITGEIDNTIGRNLVPLWFWENGWQRKQAREFGQIGVILISRF